MIEEEVDDRLQDVIQDLYEIQTSVHGYAGPETQRVLAGKVHELVANLQRLSTTSQSLDVAVPPEIITYLEEGRNPDIYTREFVELVQKANMYLKGKSEAFATFRDLLAEELVTGEVASREQVEDVVSRRVEVPVHSEQGEEIKSEMKT